MHTEPALHLQGLTKAFGTTRAVGGLDLAVRRGAMYGFIGPSGAGKTTCIRMISRRGCCSACSSWPP